jgi:hypothetical protein
MDPELTLLDDLYHAHWRLKIIRHLLEAHRASPWKGNVSWRLQEADYLQRLASAEDQLLLCRRKMATYQQTQVDAYAREAS